MHVDVVYVKRTLDIEAHSLVKYSKFVGCKTWSGIISNPVVDCNSHLGVSF
jgi:hypothetical protein